MTTKTDRTERLKKFQELWSEPTYHDVVLGVFAFSDLRCFTTDSHKLHPFFYRWAEKKVLPLMNQLYFSHRPPGGPLSNQIYNVISLMFIGRLVYTLVPPPRTGDVFFWEKGARTKIKRDCRVRFTREELRVIMEVARDFRNEFRTQSVRREV